MLNVTLRIILFFFIINSSLAANNYQIELLATVNNHSISNVDLYNEVKLIKIIENRDIPKEQSKRLLNEMINEKIKEIETKNIKIEKIQIKNIDDRIKLLLGKLNKPDQNINLKLLKKQLKKKYQIAIKWENLIYNNFKNKLEVNLNEINYILKNSNNKNIKREDIISLEKKKKLSTFSRSHFGRIKKNYLITFYK